MHLRKRSALDCITCFVSLEIDYSLLCISWRAGLWDAENQSIAIKNFSSVATIVFRERLGAGPFVVLSIIEIGSMPFDYFTKVIAVFVSVLKSSCRYQATQMERGQIIGIAIFDELVIFEGNLEFKSTECVFECKLDLILNVASS